MGARGFAASRVIWGGSPSRTQRSVMQTDWMVGSDGSSYMIFVMISSMIARRPRAPDLALDGLFRDGLQRALFEAQLDLIVGQQLVVLLAERVFRLRQDAHQIVLVKPAQGRDDRQAAHKLRNNAELQQIVRLHELEELSDIVVALALDRRVEAHGWRYRCAAR